MLALNFHETMEIIVTHIVNQNIENLKILLVRTNAKPARAFFDYIIGTNIRCKNRNEILKTIDDVFTKGVYSYEKSK